jgi:hypothetical protein
VNKLSAWAFILMLDVVVWFAFRGAGITEKELGYLGWGAVYGFVFLFNLSFMNTLDRIKRLENAKRINLR